MEQATANDEWIVSVDDHMIEPRNVWIDRLPAKYRDLGPHWISDDTGEAWLVEERIRQPVGGAVASGAIWPLEDRPRPFMPLPWSKIPPACYDPKARGEAMTTDRVLAAVMFSFLPGFAGSLFQKLHDRELAFLCIQAYNDWLLEEFSPALAGRVIGLALVPMWDGELAAQEAERALGMGARAVSFSMAPHQVGFPPIHHEHWDPLFAVMNNANLPLCTHLGTGLDGSDTLSHEVDFRKIDQVMQGKTDSETLKEYIKDPKMAEFLDGMGLVPKELRKSLVADGGDGTNGDSGATSTRRRPRPASMVTVQFVGQTTLVDWLNSGNFDRYPNLKVALAENNIGWIPAVLQAADSLHRLGRRRVTNAFDPENEVLLTEEARRLAQASIDARAEKAKKSRLPSEVFKDHIYGCFIEDPVGLKLIDEMGEDNVMIETDFPHHDTRWPHSMDIARGWLPTLSPEVGYKVLRGNAERLFQFQPIDPSALVDAAAVAQR